MSDIDSILAVVIGSIIAMGGLLALATMMEQWMKRDPLTDRVEPALAAVPTPVALAAPVSIPDRD